MKGAITESTQNLLALICDIKKALVLRVLILLPLLITSCFQDKASEKMGLTSPPNAPSSLSIVSPASEWGSDSTPTVRVEGVQSGNTVTLFFDSTCSDEAGSVVASGNYADIISSELFNDPETENDLFSFYANSSNSIGTSNCSSASVTYNLGNVPSTPTQIIKVYPDELISEVSTPRFQVSGVVEGDTVTIFADSNCSVEHGSTVADGEVIEITTSPLLSGVYDFYVNSSNKYGSSSCSLSNASYTKAGIPEPPTNLSLAEPQTSPSSDPTPSVNVTGVVPGDTIKLFSDEACLSLVGSIVATSRSVVITSSSLVPGSYKFHAKAENSYGESSCSDRELSYSYGTVPAIPSALTLENPFSSPSVNNRPSIKVSGVVSGDTVKLFSDSSCSVLLAQGVASSNFIVLDIGTYLPSGSYSFYTNSTNIYGTSSCSSSPLTYVIENCPSGYLKVPRNTDFGVMSDFCVMKYEARNHTLTDPTQNYETNLTASGSQAKCQLQGAKYDIISNAEWMTIARNIESMELNLSASLYSRGWSGNSVDDLWTNTQLAQITSASCLYNDGQNICSSSGEHLYKRFHYLTSGQEIWDFGGNLWEWVDYDHTQTGFQNFPSTSCPVDWVEFSEVDCGHDIIDTSVFSPQGNLTSSDGVGRFQGGINGAMLRGGGISSGANAGIYALSLNGNSQDPLYGFRCVYRP